MYCPVLEFRFREGNLFNLQKTLTPPGHLVSPQRLQGSMNVHRGPLLLVPQ